MWEVSKMTSSRGCWWPPFGGWISRGHLESLGRPWPRSPEIVPSLPNPPMAPPDLLGRHPLMVETQVWWSQKWVNIEKRDLVLTNLNWKSWNNISRSEHLEDAERCLKSQYRQLVLIGGPSMQLKKPTGGMFSLSPTKECASRVATAQNHWPRNVCTKYPEDLNI